MSAANLRSLFVSIVDWTTSSKKEKMGDCFPEDFLPLILSHVFKSVGVLEVDKR